MPNDKKNKNNQYDQCSVIDNRVYRFHFHDRVFVDPGFHHYLPR